MNDWLDEEIEKERNKVYKTPREYIEQWLLEGRQVLLTNNDGFLNYSISKPNEIKWEIK